MVRSVPFEPFPLAPDGLPIVGHLPRIHLDVLGLLRASSARLGPVFRLDHGFGSRPTYVYGDEGFTLLRNERVDSSANLDLARILLEGSLLPEDGPNHRRMRGAIDAPFSLRGLEASSVGEIMHDVVAHRLATWCDRSKLVINTEVSEIALSVLFRIMGVEPRIITGEQFLDRDSIEQFLQQRFGSVGLLSLHYVHPHPLSETYLPARPIGRIRLGSCTHRQVVAR